MIGTQRRERERKDPRCHNCTELLICGLCVRVQTGSGPSCVGTNVIQVHFILERGQKHIVIIKSGSCIEYDDDEEEEDDTTYDDTYAGEEDDDTANDDVVDDLWQAESTGTVQEVV